MAITAVITPGREQGGGCRFSMYTGGGLSCPVLSRPGVSPDYSFLQPWNKHARTTRLPTRSSAHPRRGIALAAGRVLLHCGCVAVQSNLDPGSSAIIHGPILPVDVLPRCRDWRRCQTKAELKKIRKITKQNEIKGQDEEIKKRRRRRKQRIPLPCAATTHA